MPEDATHAFQLWKDAGYHTGLIGKNHCFERAEDLALFDTLVRDWSRLAVRTRRDAWHGVVSSDRGDSSCP